MSEEKVYLHINVPYINVKSKEYLENNDNFFDTVMNSVDFKTSIIAYLRKREKEYDIEKAELKNEMKEIKTKIKNLNEMVPFGKNLIIFITFVFTFCSLTNASISIKSSF